MGFLKSEPQMAEPSLSNFISFSHFLFILCTSHKCFPVLCEPMNQLMLGQKEPQFPQSSFKGTNPNVVSV